MLNFRSNLSILISTGEDTWVGRVNIYQILGDFYPILKQ